MFSNGSCNTSKETEKGREGAAEGESARDWRVEESRIAGWRDGKTRKGVLTAVLVWGWTGREALGETGVCFCSDDCREKRREKKKVKWFHIVKLISKRNLNMDGKGQKHTLINHTDSGFCVD